MNILLEIELEVEDDDYDYGVDTDGRIEHWLSDMVECGEFPVKGARTGGPTGSGFAAAFRDPLEHDFNCSVVELVESAGKLSEVLGDYFEAYPDPDMEPDALTLLGKLHEGAQKLAVGVAEFLKQVLKHQEGSES